MTTNELTWHQCPRDAGQIVEISYAVDWESETLYQRSHDRSDGETTIQAGRIIDGEFAPWNGVLPRVIEWRSETASPASTSYEVRVISGEANTDTYGHRFATRDEAEAALESVREWFPGVVAEVAEVAGPATISLDDWIERGW